MRPENSPEGGDTPCAAKVKHCTGAPGPNGARPCEFSVLLYIVIVWFVRVMEDIQIGNQDILIRGVDHAK